MPPRTRLATGCYRDAYGLAAVVWQRGRATEKRYPPNTPLSVLQTWRRDTVHTLASQPAPASRGTLAADVDAYLKQVRHLASWRERRAELRAWVVRLGTANRYTITSADVRHAISAWTQAGTAPKTINNRLGALRRLYRVLDGRRALTPIDEIAPLPVPRSVPQMIAADVVRAVAVQLAAHEHAGLLRSAKTRARFLVLASTGRRPSELMRAQPTDVDLKRRVWMVRDGKGGWSPGVYLHDDALAAWTLFKQVGAWGPYETSAFARTVRHAGWPAGVRPYQLRHSVGIALSEAGRDLADVAAHLGHRRVQMTRSYYVPVLASRVQATAEALAGRLNWPAEALDVVVKPENSAKPLRAK